MSLRDLDLKASYDSGIEDNLLDDFYIKTLGNAVEYCRIAGFFSSTSLAVSARGVRGLVENEGKMKLIVSPRLSREDVEMIEQVAIAPETILENNMLREINDIENFMINDHVAALGWLLAKGILEIKVALVYDDAGNVLDYEQANEKGLFHIKVGIIKDVDNDILSFSGSINETASGWIRNIEEFKVFKLWEPGQYEYCRGDVEKFNIYWNNGTNNVKIFNMPEAVKKRIIEKSPQDINEISCLNENRAKYINKEVDIGISLFDYQKQAIKLWHKNNKKLIFEMATGTGKTRAAIGCMASIIGKYKPIVFFVICPQGTLALQWKDDIEFLKINCDENVLADSTIKNWRNNLENKLLAMAAGMTETCVVYATFDTFAGSDFMRIVTENKYNTKYMLIGDEVHGLGSQKRSQGLLDIYDYRLGLSATPDRWFDESGTKKLQEYFGKEKFEFTIKDALTTINPLTNKTYLTPYKYIPIFTTLTDEEMEKYNSLSKKITWLYNKAKTDEDAVAKLENLMFLRASIHKSAFNKYAELEKILDKIGKDIKDTIIFVSDQQMQTAIEIVSNRHIHAHKYTEKEGKRSLKKYNRMTERQYIIDKFKLNDYQVLLAIKCLDEGLDIPSAETAILLASNSNPREYVQRIGRIIRRYPGKEEATLYDIIIVPNYNRMNPDLRALEKRIFEKEMVRVFEISNNAVNSAEIVRDVFSFL